ncbi:MAG TPA: HAD family phosphatase [Streptosporangiaceae bacterium]|nr:HAD family phosphatase [Streptosporangiaceae bacterium]
MRPTANQTAWETGGRLQAVLFDMDGLLVDSEPLWFEAERAVMARLGSDWTEQDQRALVGGSLHRSVGYLLDRAARPASHEQVASWLVGGMAALLAERGVAAMPGALELIAALRAARIPHALVTSSERVIMEATLASLARHGVTFEVTVCGGDVRNPKPHPEPYQRAAALLGADPRRCVAFEDSPTGIAAAVAAGCVTIAVPGVTPIPHQPGRLVARSLAEIDLASLHGLFAAG